MDTDIINELQYGVLTCRKDGTMLYANTAASEIFNCLPGNLSNYNILSLIDRYFSDRVQLILQSPEEAIQSIGRDFIFIKIRTDIDKIYKLKFKSTKNKNILFVIYDYTTSKLDRDNLVSNINHLNAYITKNNVILKTISDICKDIFYKDRSSLSDILLQLSKTFHLDRSAICFKNGTNHIIYCRKQKNGLYDEGKIDGDLKKPCKIWDNEKNFLHEKKLIFDIPCTLTCVTPADDYQEEQNGTAHVLKLKLDDNKVIGFFEFIENENFRLSKADLDILESLSQILAYIITNKEHVVDVTNYIKQKLENLHENILTKKDK